MTFNSTPAPQSIDVANADATYAKVMWRLMPFLVGCYVVSYIDRSNIGFARLQFTRDLGFTESIYGLGSGLFYLGYLLLEIPSNLFLARAGIRLTLLRIMIPWGLCSAALAFMTSPTSFYVLRVLLGCAEAGFFPGILLYLSYWIPPSRRARFTSVFMGSIALAGVVSGPISGWIMNSWAGVLNLKGWQWLFIVEGLPAVLMGVAAYYYLDDKPAAARWLSPDEKALILRDLAREHGHKRSTSHQSFRNAARDPQIYLLMILAFALLVSTSGTFLWLPTIVRRAGVESVVNIGLLSTLPFIVGLIAQALVARHSDKTQERYWHAACPALIAALGWAALPLVSTSVVLSLVMLTLVAAGTLATMGPFWALPPALLSPAVAAPGIALITTVAGFGNFVSPILVGWLADYSGTLAIGQYYFASLLVAGAMAILMCSRQPFPRQVAIPLE